MLSESEMLREMKVIVQQRNVGRVAFNCTAIRDQGSASI
jgi:hypothetical protein